jgi:hypothetical protein
VIVPARVEVDEVVTVGGGAFAISDLDVVAIENGGGDCVAHGLSIGRLGRDLSLFFPSPQGLVGDRDVMPTQSLHQLTDTDPRGKKCSVDRSEHSTPNGKGLTCKKFVH